MESALEAAGDRGQGGLARPQPGGHRQRLLLPLKERNHFSRGHPPGPLLQPQGLRKYIINLILLNTVFNLILGTALPQLRRDRRRHRP